MSRKSFTLAYPTAPTAEPQVAAPQKPVPPDVQTSRRSAFTWRQDEREQDALDDLVRFVRRSTGRRVDKADVLSALVDVANQSESTRGALIGRLTT